MLETLPENLETPDKKSICESCGKEFSCGANTGKCWCFEVEIDGKSLAKLSKDFASCLCLDCLSKLTRQGSEKRDETIIR